MRSEVTLPVHEHVPQREWLGHAYDRVIHSRIAMRMVFTDYVTNHAGRFLVGLVEVIAQLTHGVQDTAMDGLETIPDIGQGTTDNYAHRVVEIGLLHLLFEAD